MNLWSVFLTGLLAGGASCAAVQGGLLAGVVARRSGGHAADLPDDDRAGQTRRGRAPATLAAGSTRTAGTTQGRRRGVAGPIGAPPAALPASAEGRTRSGLDDIVPVGGFLVGKLVSHTLFGALLGLVGGAAQIGFQTRALMQIAAGVLMLLLAANLLGVRSLQRLVPAPPPRLARLVRRTARSEAAAAPALLGFVTVLIPCGVTLSVMFLAVASGSAFLGALGMAVFVLGTTPLFAVLGYAVRRSSNYLGGRLGKLAAGAVVIAGVLSINSGLVLGGSSITLQSLWPDRRDAPVGEHAAVAGPALDPSGGLPSQGGSAAAADGVQRLVIDVRDTSYSPGRLQARAGVPTELILRTDHTQGCTRGFVIPSANVQRILPPTGETTINLGPLKPGRLNYTCSMGMYRGSIDVT